MQIFSFFFRRIPATGFGLMRIAWAGTTLLFFLFQWNDVPFYYSDFGLLPPHLEHLVLRSDLRFTLLSFIGDPQPVFALYLLLILTLSCTLLGLFTRFMTIVSVLLVFSFHEGNPLMLGGGDTLLRNIGFILMLSPGISALSLDRLEKQYIQWKTARKILTPLSMPIWPWRVLLWQMLILYGTSLWHKMLGEMWYAGTAVISALHHPKFSRIAVHNFDVLAPLSPALSWGVLVFHAAWLLLLIPKALTDKLPSWLPRIPLKRILIFTGLLFHGAIFILMDAGSFSFVVFTGYLGLLREEDFTWMKKLFSGKKISVLFDGHCGLCLRSIFVLQICDCAKRLRYVDFRDMQEHKKYASDIATADLIRAMHIRYASGKTYQGFDAFRALSWHLPPLFPLLPFLSIPGTAQIGRRIYAKIAKRRKRCSHGSCKL